MITDESDPPTKSHPPSFKSDAEPEPSIGTRAKSRSRYWLWALAGFGLGAASAAAYLLLGGDYSVFIPRWAEIIFYPGFLAGRAVYKWRLSEEVCKVVGVLAVGFTYALLAVLLRFAWSTLRRNGGKKSSDGGISPF